ncbi:hypothetical protein LSCM4_06765 [Leishmania orientalis]|uniref:Uncharacterized protein n=1 Tax=Leishmania orientalis TaxID=2249476 RepID=A0A836I0Z1_9TRYP|nr:hypothetical protein LSCM4_06765 [Leishmania orientalis]
MDTPSVLRSSSAAAFGSNTAPFVPCTEDSAHTRRVGRHPSLFQRTIDAVSYRYLAASSRLARAVASSSSDNKASTVALDAAAAVNAAHAAYVATLTENYQQLWQQRGLVPKAARREWFETVVVHLKALNALGATLAWLTDAPTTVVTAAAAAATDEGKDDRMSAGGSTSPSGSIAPATLSGHDDDQRKHPRLKKSTNDPLPLWYLWQDAQRHLHHMTLRLRPQPSAAGGGHGMREAMRMSDLARMDSSAFAWRVHQWCHIAALLHSAGRADTAAASSCAKIIEKVQPGMIADVMCLVSPSVSSSNSPASPLPRSFAAEEPEVARMLLLCLGPDSATAAEDLLAPQHVAGALVYRMVIEVTLGRLRALPRCIFTWRLFRDVVRDHLIASPPGYHVTEEKQRVVLLAITAYVEVVIIPYLEHRDGHLQSLRHTAAQVHAQFTHLASAKLAQLRAAVASADAGDGDTTGAGAQSGVGSADEMANSQSVATAPSTEATAGGSDKEEQGRLPETQRRRMATSMELLLRCACAGGAAAFWETKAQSFATSHTTSGSETRDSQDIVASIILGNTATVDKAELLEAGDGQHSGASTVPSAAREEELLSIQRDFHQKRVDDRVLHSSAARISQLRLFLYHYFTQSPTLSFDRVSNTAAADPLTAHAEVGGSRKAE